MGRSWPGLHAANHAMHLHAVWGHLPCSLVSPSRQWAVPPSPAAVSVHCSSPSLSLCPSRQAGPQRRPALRTSCFCQTAAPRRPPSPSPPPPPPPHPPPSPQDPSKACAAEQVLLQFRRSARPLPACRHLLDHSPHVEARFHAACTLREALVREWTAMGHDEVGRGGGGRGGQGQQPLPCSWLRGPTERWCLFQWAAGQRQQGGRGRGGPEVAIFPILPIGDWRGGWQGLGRQLLKGLP
jgi:hypothetical protein